MQVKKTGGRQPQSRPQEQGTPKKPQVSRQIKLLRFGSYGAAVLLFFWGQVQLVSEHIVSGLLLILGSFGLLGLAQLKCVRLPAWWAGFQTWLASGLERLSSGHEAAPAPAEPSKPAAATAAEPARRPGKTFAAFEKLQSWLLEDRREITISKQVVLFSGIALLVVAQFFLFWEKFIPAFLLLIPSAALLCVRLFSPQSKFSLGTRGVLLRGLLLALPGLLLIGIGDLILLKYVHVRFHMEALGIALNTVGVFLLLALLPERLEDPEPETGDPLDYSWEQKLPLPWKVRAALAAAGLGLLYWVSKLTFAHSFTSVYLAVAALGLLAFSFPWSGVRALAVRSPLWKLGRLLLFGLALYFAYHGQSLLAHEQLYPGLTWYGLAALLLLATLREPDSGKPDDLKESPMKWQWEALGLAIILAAAFWLRARLITAVPYGIECDEAGGTVNALDLVRNLNSFTAHPVGAPIVLLLPRVISTALFGIQNLGIKADAVFFGVVGVAAAYFFLRRLWGPRTALAAAALMAVSRWHIHFSRFGFNNTFFIVLLMLGFYFLVRGLQTRRKWSYVFSGVAFSLVVQTETASRMLPIILFVLLIYLLLSQRHFIKRNWQPLAALFLGVWLAGASMYIFYAKNSHVLMGRVQEVSIYSGDPNAPRQIAKGFLESVKSSLTMLNFHGDYRPRHNGGMTGEPMLDFWTSILFALGFLYSVYHWKRWRYGLTLVWFFGFMSASIFSIEAPQAHRAFGIFPTVILLIGAFLDRSRRLLQETLGKTGLLLGGAVFLVLLVPVSTINYHKYFDTSPAFDNECTAVARFIGGRYPLAEHVVMTASLWQGHPPYILHAGKTSGRFYYAASEAVPVRKELGGQQDVVFSTLLEYPPLLPALKYFYPEGKPYEEVHPKWGLQFRSWVVSHEAIMRTRGLNASYWNGAGSGTPALKRKDDALPTEFTAKTWPLPGAGSAAWEGTLMIPHEGRYTFFLASTDPAEVELGDRVRLNSSGGRETRVTAYLAGGLHRLTVKAKHATPGGRLSFDWSCAQGVTYFLYDSPYQNAFERQSVPGTHLFTYPAPAGLLGTLYASRDWRGQVLQQKIEPALLFVWMGGPYGFKEPVSADWKGWIDVQAGGDYKFEVQNSGYAEVVVDGKTVVRNGQPPTGWTPPSAAPDPLRLTAGRHPITVRWSVTNGSVFKFWWTPPGGSREIVPPQVLIPASEE